jgi:hypothetical protein
MRRTAWALRHYGIISIFITSEKHGKQSVSTSITTSSAERMRRHRQRRRDGMRCFQLEIRDTEIDELICRKLLKQEMRNDKQSIIDAIYEFLEDSLDAAE